MTNHLKKAASGMMVLLVGLQVLGKVVNSLGENSDLYFGRTCVAFVESVLLDDCGFSAAVIFFTSLKYFFLSPSQRQVCTVKTV